MTATTLFPTKPKQFYQLRQPVNSTKINASNEYRTHHSPQALSAAFPCYVENPAGSGPQSDPSLRQSTARQSGWRRPLNRNGDPKTRAGHARGSGQTAVARRATAHVFPSGDNGHAIAETQTHLTNRADNGRVWL